MVFYIYRKRTVNSILSSTVALANLDTTRLFRWRDNSIVNILNDETYLGHTVSMKHTTASYKNKKQIIRPESEWLRFKNTHENIISQELWDIAHEVREHKKRPRKNMEDPNTYSGLIFCADCGKPLVLHRAHAMDESKNNFACSTYKRFGKETCSSHYIRESQLAAVILDDLKRVTHFARQDNVLSCIPDEHYRTLSGEYTTEQKSLRESIPKAEARMEKLKNPLTNVDRFIEKAKKYTKLTPKLSALYPALLGECSQSILMNTRLNLRGFQFAVIKQKYGGISC
ncbi:recombinase zinc beta ribbon domain-containing protein [Lutispora saccharofermentans]|uniref:Recombinase zinc beta ribbon domain-containing protein n=1 Tax=Lutispora saccharofermentans TaxID=3024236 RepID=A0ABT1NBA7_9FIRM|nr:recombinase zinc beta ribbon domain-containing protein [Lutispora saccharofermentans]MCQ1528539.1 recombinase zinc beta ribbon domain-containing protein [Lutispora saccharofermentans]